MTIKIEISHFYDYREPKQLKKKTKSDIFLWNLFKSDTIPLFIKKY